MKRTALFLALLTLALTLLPGCTPPEEDPAALDAKPVIYLYPEAETEVTVSLDYDGELTCVYPAMEDGVWTVTAAPGGTLTDAAGQTYNGELTCVYPAFDGGASWSVTAAPDGTLTDAAGQTYNYLYWEGVSDAEYDFSEGFCVPGGDTAAFLEDALAALGLNRREANEFIVYWLPRMEGNAYNLIAFQTTAYTDHARLTVDPAPDTVLRVFMAWRPLSAPADIPPQALTAPERTGFTLVEWGGAELS